MRIILLLCLALQLAAQEPSFQERAFIDQLKAAEKEVAATLKEKKNFAALLQKEQKSFNETGVKVSNTDRERRIRLAFLRGLKDSPEGQIEHSKTVTKRLQARLADIQTQPKKSKKKSEQKRLEGQVKSLERQLKALRKRRAELRRQGPTSSAALDRARQKLDDADKRYWDLRRQLMRQQNKVDDASFQFMLKLEAWQKAQDALIALRLKASEKLQGTVPPFSGACASARSGRQGFLRGALAERG